MTNLNEPTDPRTDPDKMLQEAMLKNAELTKKLLQATAAVEETLLWYIPVKLREKLNITIKELKA